MWQKIGILITVLFFITGCAIAEYKADTTMAMKGLYRPWQEIGFCLLPDGQIRNIQIGTVMTAPIPICNKGDIVMHTHPIFADPFASPGDVSNWKEYKRVYGIREYGIMKKHWYKVYEIK